MYHNYKIKNGLFGSFDITPYEPIPKQIEIVNKLRENRFNIIRKSRGIGVSTAINVEVIDQALRKRTNIMYVTPTSSSRNELNMIVDTLQFSNIPEDSYVVRNKHIKFMNGSNINFIHKAHQYCSKSSDWVIMSEIAYHENINEMVYMVFPTLNEGGKITLSSTPTPKYTPFNGYYFEALKGDNDFVITDALWFDNPFFGEDVYWVHPDGSSKSGFSYKYEPDNLEMTNRMLQLGWVRTSKKYQQHLKMYGEENSNAKFEFEAHLTPPPSETAK
jgi:hypothetical protein